MAKNDCNAFAPLIIIMLLTLKYFYKKNANRKKNDDLIEIKFGCNRFVLLVLCNRDLAVGTYCLLEHNVHRLHQTYKMSGRHLSIANLWIAPNFVFPT